MMRVTFLGTAGYFPAAQRHTLAVLIQEVGLMFDAGTGVARLAQTGAPSSLDIFLSHAHLDHICGLTYLVGLAAHCRIEKIAIHGEAAKLAAIQEHLFSELIFPVKPPFSWHPLDPGASVTVGRGGKLTSFPLAHPGGSVGYRIDWPDQSLAYVTDTTASPDAPYIDAIRGVDLLIHECNFSLGGEEWAAKTGHSWTTAVGEVAQKAAVQRLAVLHVSPLAAEDAPIQLDEIRSVFPSVVLANDGMHLDF